jgi:hypothetical protein
MRTIRLLIATVAALLLVGVLGAGTASAQDYPIVPPDQGALPDTLTPPDVAPLAQQAPVSSNVGGLPVTGGDLVGLTAIGAGAIVAGALLVRARRQAA